MKTKEAIEFDDIDAQKFLYYIAKDDPKNKEKYNAVSKLILLLLNEKSEREQHGEKFGGMLKKVNELIKELGEEMTHSREEDQFGYPKQTAIKVYHSVIQRLKEINIPKEE